LVEGGDDDLDFLIEDRKSRVIFLGKILDDDDGGGDLVGDLVDVFGSSFHFFG
jgi:hypothetical protein